MTKLNPENVAISRRLRKLEDGYGLVPETEFSKRLRERLEAGVRRVAELGAQEGRRARNPERDPEKLSQRRPS